MRGSIFDISIICSLVDIAQIGQNIKLVTARYRWRCRADIYRHFTDRFSLYFKFQSF